MSQLLRQRFRKQLRTGPGSGRGRFRELFEACTPDAGRRHFTSEMSLIPGRAGLQPTCLMQVGWALKWRICDMSIPGRIAQTTSRVWWTSLLKLYMLKAIESVGSFRSIKWKVSRSEIECNYRRQFRLINCYVSKLIYLTKCCREKHIVAK